MRFDFDKFCFFYKIASGTLSWINSIIVSKVHGIEWKSTKIRGRAESKGSTTKNDVEYRNEWIYKHETMDFEFQMLPTVKTQDEPRHCQ